MENKLDANLWLILFFIMTYVNSSDTNLGMFNNGKSEYLFMKKNSSHCSFIINDD